MITPAVLYLIIFLLVWIFVTAFHLKEEQYPDSVDYLEAAVIGFTASLVWPFTLVGLSVIGAATGIIYLSKDYNREEMALVISKYMEGLKDQEKK